MDLASGLSDPAQVIATPAPSAAAPLVTAVLLAETARRTGIVLNVILLLVATDPSVTRRPVGIAHRTVIGQHVRRMVTPVPATIGPLTATVTVESLGGTARRMGIVPSAILLRAATVLRMVIVPSAILRPVEIAPATVTAPPTEIVTVEPRAATAQVMAIVTVEPRAATAQVMAIATAALLVATAQVMAIATAALLVATVPRMATARSVTLRPVEIAPAMVTAPRALPMVTVPTVIRLLAGIAHRTVTDLSARALPRTLVSEPAESGRSAFVAVLSKRR